MIGLVLIDIQNFYFKGGSSELYQPEEAASKAADVLNTFRKKGYPIFHVQHLDKNTKFVEPGTEADFNKSIYPMQDEIKIVKHTPDSFLETSLDYDLRKHNVDSIVVCGMMTHMCVDTSVRTAVNHGYKVILVGDACATRDLKWNDNIIPAETVQNTYLASIDKWFADVVKADESIEIINKL